MVEAFSADWERNRDIYEKLDKAIENSRTGYTFMRLLKSALQHEYPINFLPNSDSYPLIHSAINWRQWDLVQALLDADTDVNVKDNFGRNVLMTAIKSGAEAQMIIEIAKKTDNLNLIDHSITELSALGMLCQRYVFSEDKVVFPCIRYLLDVGADLEAGRNYMDGKIATISSYISRAKIINKFIETYLQQKNEMQNIAISGYEYEI